MSSILLTSDGDIDLSRRGLSITTDLQTLAVQQIRGRLLLFLSEWFLDSKLGFPWIQTVFVKNPDLTAVRLLLRQAILDAPTVSSILSADVSFDPLTRILGYSFEAKLVDGGTLAIGDGTPFGFGNPPVSDALAAIILEMGFYGLASEDGATLTVE